MDADWVSVTVHTTMLWEVPSNAENSPAALCSSGVAVSFWLAVSSHSKLTPVKSTAAPASSVMVALKVRVS
jgi:hypothetical protein